MKHIKYTCDKCGQEIEGVMYTLTCYAEDVNPSPTGRISTEAAVQNVKQNGAKITEQDRHLCRSCKDAITDGIFIL